MPVPASIDDLSTTPGSNSPAGSESPTDGDNYIRTYGSFIAILRDKLDGTSDTGVVKNATFSGTMAGAASWSGLQTFAAGVSVSTGGNVLSGTYTPTLTGVINVASSTAKQCQWIRVGSVVTVSGGLDIDPTAPGTTVIGISLPIASTLAAIERLGGQGGDIGLRVTEHAIYADTTNNRAEYGFVTSTGANATHTFIMSYLIS